MKRIFEETNINGVTLKNRLWRSATWEGLATEDGAFTPELTQLYENLILGGAGAVMVGGCGVIPKDRLGNGLIGLFDDSQMPGHIHIAQLAQAQGVLAMPQLMIAGTNTRVPEGKDYVLTPSGIPHATLGVEGKYATKEDLQYVVGAFAAAAKRAQRCGYRGVEVHIAHDYFLNQFMSARYNRRTDDYGPGIENRAKLLWEILDAIRAAVGADYIVGIKLNSEDFCEDGLTREESLYLAVEGEKHGLSFIEVSGGSKFTEKGFEAIRSGVGRTRGEAYFEPHAKTIAGQVRIPVALVGGIRSKETMERLLNETPIEYLSMSRPFICEPDFPNKLQRGESEKSRCISCERCLLYTDKVRQCIFHKA